MVRRILLITMLLISFAAIGCDQINKTFGIGKPQKVDLQKVNLKCTIDTASNHIAKGEKLLVDIKVENLSSKEVRLRLIPTFQLGNLWAPVDFVKGKWLPENSKMLFSLKKGQSLNSRIDLSKLGWDQTGSSNWPAQNLYSIISSGKFKLFLDIYVADNNYSLKSNKIELVFDKSK